MTIGQTGIGAAGLVLFGLVSLSAPGLAEAHGAPGVENVPEGFVKARITHHPEIEGLSAIILDAPRPGIMLRYQGEEPLTVLGTEGEAFLQFTRTEVAVNSNSPSWRSLPNRSSTPNPIIPVAGQQPEQSSWVRLSQSGSFGWLDPRLNALDDSHNERDISHSWSISVATADGDTHHIRGRLMFTSFK